MKLRVNSCDGIYKDSLDVRFTKKCDNRCSFCIENDGIKGLGQTNVEEMIKSTINSGKKDVLILGGEPFLQPDKLLAYISGIRRYVNNVYITTSLPKQLDVSNETVVKILGLIDGLNVSLHHYDFKRNNEVLIATSGHNRLDQLKQILSMKGVQAKVRVCTNLVSGGLDSREEIITFIRTVYDIGCRSIKLNELQRVDEDTYVSFEEMTGLILPSPYAHGCQTNINDMIVGGCGHEGLNIILKRSCFLVQPESKKKVTVQDTVKFFLNEKVLKPAPVMKVLYENGTLSNGWKQK